MTTSLKAVLVLEDGSVIHGKGFGSEKTVRGELVFNTGMTGYQEALTDPSYNGQILMMTYPLIGNYGISADYWESDKIQAEGFVVREVCNSPSHRASIKTLDEYLSEQGIPGISEVDTRELTIKTREFGTLRAILKTFRGQLSLSELDVLRYEARTMPSPEKYNLVAEVSCKEASIINPTKYDPETSPAGRKRILLIDCGTKLNIIRELLKRDCTVIRASYNISADEINRFKPDGILISNGPGDPAHPEIMDSVVKTIREIAHRYPPLQAGVCPVMGICLGHQILSLVFSAKTYKLKFGHRGANQPVRWMSDNSVPEADPRERVRPASGGKVYITSQNHSFAVSPESCSAEIEITAINVNDGTVEAMRHKKLPIFSVQYHPEASPGPWDSKYLFDRFVTMCHPCIRYKV
ncbi:MAG: glutamine-hydrolyzing carbamoyl-phosphate synthase small subunit [Planctomycetota bacterium]|nr:glutamine-hydrolyzing carbamoyl-phosphate synthase small subunit [Planctomycetota bacterium]MDI6788058.1 glutamine-hydrolyzing carbamoyl-phosphate synthase small subunit [Planctomycetota bacterium]